MKLFHTTDAAEVIRARRFRDRQVIHGAPPVTLCGVFISDTLVDADSADDRRVLSVELGDHVDLSEFELMEEGKAYREWCVPATLLNGCAVVRLLTDAEVKEGAVPRCGWGAGG